MNVLGISALYHDSAACLVRDGRIVAAAQEERFTRRKHDAAFPRHAIRYCLEEGGLEGGDLDLVAFHEKPFLRFERLLETHLAYAPWGCRQFSLAMSAWLREKLWVKDALGKELSYDGRILFPEHHQSHAAAAFFPSPFHDAAILTIDGVGEWATAIWGEGEGNRIRLAAEQRFPNSLGLLYSAFTYYLGFRVNSGEYKVMGLAPYGEPRFVKRILEHLIDLKPDGSFRLNMEFFGFAHGLRMTNRRFERLFGGPPRKPEAELETRHMDLARSIQAVTEEVVLRMVRHLHRQSGHQNLVVAGGVALNCVANGKVLREGPFEKLWVQPASGDAGAALGAALYAYHQYGDGARSADGITDGMQGALLGPEFSDGEVGRFLDEAGARYERLDEASLLPRVAGLLADGAVVGWFQGRMEFGPRALGNRSILADPRDAGMQRRVNREVKFREDFRPFAPAVLEERVGEYFALEGESPYMLLVAPVRERVRCPLSAEDRAVEGLDRLDVVRSSLPAVTHVDDSARIQTVGEKDNPRFRRLLEAFEARTGCPVLVNTSFNVRHEPIVCTPEDAYQCYLHSGIDHLALGPYLLSKPQGGRRRDRPRRSPGGSRDGVPVSEWDLRLFGFGLAVILGSATAFLVAGRTATALVAAAAAVVVGAIASLAPQRLRPLYVRWMKVARRINAVVVFVLTGAVYFTVVTPTGWVARAVGRRFIDHRPDSARESYWDPRSPALDDAGACESQSQS